MDGDKNIRFSMVEEIPIDFKKKFKFISGVTKVRFEEKSLPFIPD